MVYHGPILRKLPKVSKLAQHNRPFQHQRDLHAKAQASWPWKVANQHIRTAKPKLPTLELVRRHVAS